MTSFEIVPILSKYRLDSHNEKNLQEHIAMALGVNGIWFDREYRLDASNIVDFMVHDGIAMEVKIKGSKRQIYKQCERYCSFEKVKELILITSQSMGMPPQINNKPIYILNLGRAWL